MRISQGVVEKVQFSQIATEYHFLIADFMQIEQAKGNRYGVGDDSGGDQYRHYWCRTQVLFTSCGPFFVLRRCLFSSLLLLMYNFMK